MRSSIWYDLKSFRSLFIYFSGGAGLASGPSVLHVLKGAGAKVRTFGILFVKAQRSSEVYSALLLGPDCRPRPRPVPAAARPVPRGAATQYPRSGAHSTVSRGESAVARPAQADEWVPVHYTASPEI